MTTNPEAATPVTAETLAFAMEQDGWEFNGDPVLGAQSILDLIPFKMAEAAATASPGDARLRAPDISVLASVLDDAPGNIIESAKGDGEGLAAWIVSHWVEYAALADVDRADAPVDAGERTFPPTGWPIQSFAATPEPEGVERLDVEWRDGVRKGVERAIRYLEVGARGHALVTLRDTLDRARLPLTDKQTGASDDAG